MNVAIVTARGGSASIVNKNLLPVLGQPMVQYPIKAAQTAKRVGDVWVSTDGEGVAEAALEAGAKVVPRPRELGDAAVDHGAVIKHAVEYVDARVADLENVVILLGSTVYIDGDVIDLALGLLADRKDLDSVMTVWEAADDHPYRALGLTGDGLIESFGGPRTVATAPASYPKAYYYDQGLWAFRKQTVQHQDGPSPWWWMGKRVHPIVRPWVTGRGLRGPIDVFFSEHWVQHPEVAARLGEDNR
jgi:N-acylneuraminate cytidylyltransferase